MGVFHYLNVKQGDCSIIQHPSGHVTVVDVCNVSKDTSQHYFDQAMKSLVEERGIRGDFNQKDYPVNPIAYMREHRITDVFRFVLSHPEMDHMDGIKDFFEEFNPTNFWDTANTCEKDDWDGSPHDEDDWDFYRAMRDGYSDNGAKRLMLYSGARGKYWNQAEDGSGGGDGLHILAPTPELTAAANESGDHNDASHVILYQSAAGRILLSGDSHDATWEHILNNHRGDVEDVDLLIAPHHGRKSGRSYDFLDVVRPRLTFFGNANSKHLAYGAWQYRGLQTITNNQADCMVVDTNGQFMDVYVTNRSFAQKIRPDTFYSGQHRAYYIGHIRKDVRRAA